MYFFRFYSGSVASGGGKSGTSVSVGGIKSYFRMVSEHKDIVRSVMALQGMMYMYKPDIEKLLKVLNACVFTETSLLKIFFDIKLKVTGIALLIIV